MEYKEMSASIMKYFSHCKTIEDVKAIYKQLAKQYHPDLGGDTAIMQAINTEYAFACVSLAKGAGLSDDQANNAIKLSEEYRQVVEKIIYLPGIVIEIVGNWIWVTGNTLPVKNNLKEAGFYFAFKKAAWYYRNETFKTRGNGAPLEEIRRKYGSENIDKKYNNQILQD